jgi:hypothetical protein
VLTIVKLFEKLPIFGDLSTKVLEMKKLTILLFFTVSVTATAFAGNEVDPKEPEPKHSQQYTFSLTKAYFALFNLFTIEPSVADSSHKDVRKPKPKVKGEDDFLFFPIGM